MIRCPRCGADGAIVTHVSAYRGDLQSEIYCNMCQQTSTVPEYLKQMLEPKGCRTREAHQNYIGPIWVEKEDGQAMRVSYNGFSGLLRKLEADGTELDFLDIWDAGKRVTYSFPRVELSDVKFLGGAVSFGE